MKKITTWWHALKKWHKVFFVLALLTLVGTIGQRFDKGYQAKKAAAGNPSVTPSSYLIKNVAYPQIKKAVLAKLLSPASARFPDDFGTTIDKDNDWLYITGYVDSQNSYGAILRKNWMGRVQFDHRKPDDHSTWTYEVNFID